MARFALMLAWAAMNAIPVVVLVGLDWIAREESGSSFMAPSTNLLWVSIGLGALLGVATAAATRYATTSQRNFAAKFARLPYRERLRWTHQRLFLLYYGWWFAAFCLLAAWCLFWWVFILPAVFAMNGVVLATKTHARAALPLTSGNVP